MEVNGQRFDGFGIGGALGRRRTLGTIVGWVSESFPRIGRVTCSASRSRMISSRFLVEAGADTFDCVNPSRVARNAAIYSPDGRFNVTRQQFKRISSARWFPVASATRAPITRAPTCITPSKRRR